MKQMIKNHREIETLEDFIYYDKASGKIKIKKELDLEVPITTKLYNHIIRLSRTNDVEDDPYLVIMFQSNKETYTKAEFEVFVKNVATVNNNPSLGIPCVAYNGGYDTQNGAYLLYFNSYNSKFLGTKTQGTGTHNIDFGTSFAYYEIVSKQI